MVRRWVATSRTLSLRRRSARRILAALKKQHPNPHTELRFRNPFELLVATILSAQCTDERVNRVTPDLFKRFPDPKSLAQADLEELKTLVKPTGFFRSKARSLIGAAALLTEEHDGKVPASMKSLVKLPGVGRKTANVVLGHALNVPGFPVDRHVLRVARRLGLTQFNTAEAVEAELTALFPARHWTNVSDTLIRHGRSICKPRPHCKLCTARNICAYTESSHAIPTST